MASKDRDAISQEMGPEFAVVIPTLNEAPFITKVLERLENALTGGSFLLFVVDGGSTDNTKEIVKNFAIGKDHISCLDNEKKNQSAAVNTVSFDVLNDHPSVKYIVRMDAHAIYPDQYVQNLLKVIKRVAADSVVVPMDTIGGNPVQCAASDLFSSILGHGGAHHRAGNHSGFVKHGHHAIFKRTSFIEVGGYDESFISCEDAEFDHRLTLNGGKIYMDASNLLQYIPRSTYKAFAKQFSRNGYYRAKMFIKHKRMPGIRQFIPIVLMPAIILSLIFSILASTIFLIIPLLYIIACLIGAWICSSKHDLVHMSRIFLLAITTHLSYSLGANWCFLKQCFMSARAKNRTPSSSLT